MSDLELRGVFPSDESYRFSLRRFQTTFQGDTVNAFSDNRRHGFLAVAETSVKAFEIDFFGRSYIVETPDSVTKNLTTSLGIAYGWSTGDAEPVGRSELIQLGLVQQLHHIEDLPAQLVEAHLWVEVAAGIVADERLDLRVGHALLAEVVERVLD